MSDKIYVDVILRNEQGRFLLQHHPQSKLKAWRFPGGKPEPGETFIGAAAREAKEELGIEPLFLEYVGKKTSTVESGTWTGYMFLCKCYIGTPRNVESEKHGEIRWLTLEEIGLEKSEPEYTFARKIATGQVDAI